MTTMTMTSTVTFVCAGCDVRTLTVDASHAANITNDDLHAGTPHAVTTYHPRHRPVRVERIAAADVRVGDMVQQYLRRWPPRTVTRITSRYFALPGRPPMGGLTFELGATGVRAATRVAGVAPETSFLRYPRTVES